MRPTITWLSRWFGVLKVKVLKLRPLSEARFGLLPDGYWLSHFEMYELSPMCKGSRLITSWGVRVTVLPSFSATLTSPCRNVSDGTVLLTEEALRSVRPS